MKNSNKPDLNAAFNDMLADYQQQNFQTALAKADTLLKHYPKQEAVLNLAAIMLVQLEQTDAAIAKWTEIPESKRSHSMWNNLGKAYRRLQQYEQAETCVRRSLQLKADNPEALWNLVLLQNDTGRIEEALKTVEVFLVLKPKDAAAWEYAAMFSFNSGDFQTADTYQMKVLAVQPERWQMWVDNAWANRRLKRYAVAEERYRVALALKDDIYEAWFGVGKMCHFQQKYEAACHALERALQLQPDSIEAQSDLVLNRLYVLGEAARGAADSFRLGDLYAEKAVKIAAPKVQAKEKLHIGLVSSDLRRHPVGMFAKGLLLSDVAKQFTWTAYANSDITDSLSEEICPTFAAWHAVKSWSDEKIIEQIRSDGIDILIDLNGYTSGHRMGVFAAQAAPLQISWLGYFATTGLPTMQAVIADAYCVPEAEEKWFRERVYRMPHTRLCMAKPEINLEPNALPALQNGYITFGCFQNLTKLNDNVLKVWSLVAKTFPTAHWRFQTDRLKEGSSDQIVFKQKLLDLGFPEQNLHFHGVSGYQNYMQAYHETDILLDTFPFPGGTTTVDALWMGVPTLTLALEGMLARQGQQFLSAAGLENWIAHGLDEYLQKAFYWLNPQHWQQLAELRQTMRQQVAASPVFDSEQFSRDWCDLVRKIWQNFTE